MAGRRGENKTDSKKVPGRFHHSLAGLDDLGDDHGFKLGSVEADHRRGGRGGQHHIFGRQPGEGQGPGIGQAPGAAAQTKHMHIPLQPLIHQDLHHIDAD